VTAQDLAIKLGIPLGEALVILYEIRKQKSEGSAEGEKAGET